MKAGIVEKVPDTPINKEFCLPHKYVVKEKAETTKLRIVYDASARATTDSPSLNECLNSGPSLQNKLWDVLIQQRMFPVMLSADMRQAFLQIQVRESERDALRFHWRKYVADEIEAKMIREVLCVSQTEPASDEFDDLLERSSFHRTLRICAWINRFIHNSRRPGKRVGPIATEEVKAAKEWWIKRVQFRDTLQSHYLIPVVD